MRQLQGPYGPIGKVNGIAPITKGGTGASSAAEAVSNLGGISTDSLGKPLGPIKADDQGRLPYTLLVNAGLLVGYSLEGPTNLVNGQTSIYRLTNWSTDTSVAVGVSAGSAVIVGDELHVTAPATGTSVTLSLGDRQIILPILTPGSQLPVIISPVANSENPGTVTFMTAPFSVAAETYSDWTDVTASGTTTVSVPSNAIGIEIEGRRGDAGAAYMTLSDRNYQLGISTTRRRVDFSGQATLSILINGTGSMKYRWVVSSATHASTDWEVATDAAFSSIVVQSMNDALNKTSWAITLQSGSYFVRARFNAILAV